MSLRLLRQGEVNKRCFNSNGGVSKERGKRILTLINRKETLPRVGSEKNIENPRLRGGGNAGNNNPSESGVVGLPSREGEGRRKRSRTEKIR